MSRITDHSSPKALAAHPSYPNLSLVNAPEIPENSTDGRVEEVPSDPDLLDFTLTSGPIELALITKDAPNAAPNNNWPLS